MRGIATIDRQPGSDVVAVWITSRDSLDARNVNAVVIDMADGPDAIERVRSLTRCCAVLATEGSVLDGLPVEGEVLRSLDISALVQATKDQQQAILNAISAFKGARGAKAQADPEFPLAAEAADFVPADDTPSQRAFTTANYLGRAWTAWLKTDEERRRRTVRPRTGESPWMMPEELNSPTVAVFPPAFAAKIYEQALV